MAAIRMGDAGYKAYVYVNEQNSVVVQTPSFNGTIRDMKLLVTVCAVLNDKKELPDDIIPRVMEEMANVFAANTWGVNHAFPQ